MDIQQEMNNLINPLVDSMVQCWGCPVFDRLVSVVSGAAGAVYGRFALFCMILFCALFAFFVFNAVWNNLKGGMTDPFYTKSVQPVIISALFVLTLLSMGVYVPRLVTSITFEPVAEMTLRYTQGMVGLDDAAINERVTYTPVQMSDTGFYRPQLRDKIVMIMKTTVTQFQGYMKLGLAVIDASFSWRALLGIGAFIKHLLMLFTGLYLVYGFFKLFVRFCFYFADIIVAMTYFAFFFPLSLIIFAFQGSDAPDWIKNMGKNFGAGQFKKVIGAIVGLASAVLTYTVIMVLIARFFSGSDTDATQLMTLISSGDVFAGDISDENLAAMTLMGAVVLIYVINYIANLSGEVTKMVLAAFDVKAETEISEALASDALTVTKDVLNIATQAAKTIVGGESAKAPDDQKKSDDKDGGKK